MNSLRKNSTVCGQTAALETLAECIQIGTAASEGPELTNREEGNVIEFDGRYQLLTGVNIKPNVSVCASCDHVYKITLLICANQN